MLAATVLVLLCPGLRALPQISGTLNSQPSSLQAGQKQFARRMLQLVESTADSNFVLSPHSLHSAFSQVLQGAGGRTQAQLESVLGVQASDSLVDQYRSLGQGLGQGSAALREANLMAVARDFKPKTGFRGDLLTGFQSDIRQYDFGSDPARSVSEINRYVAEKTNQKIRDLLADDDVDSFTRLVLINAVYFKANWKYAFTPEDTFTHTFQSPVAGNVQTDYMNRDAEVRLFEDKERQLDILELPYDDASKAMLIVLPKESVPSTDSIVERMGDLDLGDVRRRGTFADTAIFIPKFKLKYQTYLKEKMENLGATEMFTTAANLTGISDEALSVSEGVHQAFIEVNEEGTEAAAATAVVVGLRTARQKRQFFANRPFLFVVYDFRQGVALFAGKVVDPSRDTIIQRRSSLTQTPVSTTPAQANPVCSTMFRDFPNSLDNTVICEKVESEGKRFEWLRKNRGLCEESKDLFNTFKQNSCDNQWCLEATQHINNWRSEASSDRCLNVEGRVETIETKRACKNVKNKLKAVEYLHCTF